MNAIPLSSVAPPCVHRAWVDFDEPEPLEEFDDDDNEDDPDDPDILTDVLALK